MAVDFFFSPATINLPIKKALHWFSWVHIRDEQVRGAIAEEEQYLRFHLEVLDKLHFTEEGKIGHPPYVQKVGLTARAGLIRSTVLLYASITEAVLLYHAREHSYKLSPSTKHWSFGAAMRAWENPPGSGKPETDVAAVWKKVESLRQLRNHVHLFNKAGDHRGRFEWLLQREQKLLKAGEEVIGHLREIRSDVSAQK